MAPLPPPGYAYVDVESVDVAWWSACRAAGLPFYTEQACHQPWEHQSQDVRFVSD